MLPQPLRPGLPPPRVSVGTPGAVTLLPGRAAGGIAMLVRRARVSRGEPRPQRRPAHQAGAQVRNALRLAHQPHALGRRDVLGIVPHQPLDHPAALAAARAADRVARAHGQAHHLEEPWVGHHVQPVVVRAGPGCRCSRGAAQHGGRAQFLRA